jgi:hypothetical protein
MKNEREFRIDDGMQSEIGGSVLNSETAADSHFETDMHRALMAYQFFYPSVYCLDSWDVNKVGFEFTPLSWEDNIGFWEELAKVVDKEPVYEPYCTMYQELAALGIEKGKPFTPDTRMKTILEGAAKSANANMRVRYFAGRKPGRLLWDDRTWEVAAISDDASPSAPNYTDRYVREKWLNTALWDTSSLSRMGGAGFLHCLGTCDNSGEPLHGRNTYKLTIPYPIPARLFSTITLYDVLTGSEMLAKETKATLQTLLEQRSKPGSAIELYFGPTPIAGKEKNWIRTSPNDGWFAYFRIYGPGRAAFDGSWKPGDFELMANIETT